MSSRIQRVLKSGLPAGLLLLLLHSPLVSAFDGFKKPHNVAPDEVGVAVQAFAESDKVAPGERFLFYVVATLKPGWHIYSMEALDDPSLPTRITLSEKTFQPGGSWEESNPQIVDDPFLGRMVKVHAGRAEFQRFLSVPAGTPPGVYPLSGTLTFRACDNKVCTMPKEIRFQSQIRVTDGKA
jgi:hypothetical protein